MVNKAHRVILRVIVLAVMPGLLSGCGSQAEPAAESQGPQAAAVPSAPAPAAEPSLMTGPSGPSGPSVGRSSLYDRESQWVPPKGIQAIEDMVPDPKPVVVIETNLGRIRLELDAERAPVTVENFLTSYVDEGFYQGTIVHHVEPGVLVAAGGYTADLKLKTPTVYIRNEADNGLKNLRGTVAMIRLPDHIDSASSQFFFNLQDNPKLDHAFDGQPESFGYCVFGRVVEGMDILDQIGKVPVAERGNFPSVPAQPITLLSVRRER